ALLDVGLDEVVGVRLEHVVDLVEQLVELGLDLLAGLGRRRSGLDLVGATLGGRLLLEFSFCHLGVHLGVTCTVPRPPPESCAHSPALSRTSAVITTSVRDKAGVGAGVGVGVGQRPRRSSRSAADVAVASSSPTCSSVPRVGSSIGTRLRAGAPVSNTNESQLAATICDANRARQPPRKNARVPTGASVTARSTSSSSVNRSRPSRRARPRPGRRSWYCRSMAAR